MRVEDWGHLLRVSPCPHIPAADLFNNVCILEHNTEKYGGTIVLVIPRERLNKKQPMHAAAWA
jgi:hypothetical protein